MPSRALLVATLVGLSARPTAAETTHRYDPRHERSLLTEAAIARGPWKSSASSLSIRRAAPADHWITSAVFGDGTLRVRFAGGPWARGAVLARVRQPASGRRGVGVQFEGRWLWPVRLEGDTLVPLSHRVYVGGDRDRREVEIVLSLVGGALLATLGNGATGDVAGLVSAESLDETPGAIGVWISAPDTPPDPDAPTSADTDIRLLAWRPGCAAIPAATPQAAPVVLTLPAAHARAAADVRILEDAPGAAEVAVRVDPAGLERVRCAGHDVHRVQTDLPWKYIDPGVLQAPLAPPVLPNGSYDLSAAYKTHERVHAILSAWHQNHPRDTRLEQLGVSHQGRPVWALAIGDALQPNDPRPTVLLSGAHHGDELLAIDAVLDAAQELLRGTRDELAAIRRGVVVWCVPLVNPDGVHAFFEESIRHGRKNARPASRSDPTSPRAGVDLNRNYPFGWERDCDAPCPRASPSSRYFRGEAPGSEPETQAMMALAERERFTAAISFHMGTVALLSPYTLERVPNPSPDLAWLVGETLTRALRHPERRTVPLKRSLYPVQGTDQDWLRHQHGTLAYLFEIGGWPPPLEPAARAAILAQVRPSWMLLAQRILRGPGVVARVRDARGAPLEVETRLREVTLRAHERWTTRPRDGRFVHLVPGPGRYHLEVHAHGRVESHAVDVSSAPSAIEITVAPR